MEGKKVMFALLLLVALCAVVAIIISAVTLSRPSTVPTITLNGIGGGGQSPPIVVGGGGGGSSGGSGGATSGKVYTLAIGHDWGAHQYLDEKNFIQGFSKDLILEVCEHAGIDCRIVWDSYSNCFRAVPGGHPMGGVGLYGGWYDACADWQGTTERVQVFDFGDPYLKPSEVYFFIKKSTSFDPLNIKGKTIGFINGGAADETCVARQDNIKGNSNLEYTVKYFDLTKDAALALGNGSVDSVFSSANVFNQQPTKDLGLEFKRINSTVFNCAIHGHSIMTRKDNTLIPHWNRGLKKMRESGRFQKLCAEADSKHGHKGTVHSCLL